MIQSIEYPNIYPEANDIIPYSPRRKFGFISSDKTIKLESMKNMSIDQLVELYKDGYRIENSSENIISTVDNQTIKTAQGITVSTGALVLIIGTIGLIWYLRKEGKI